MDVYYLYDIRRALMAARWAGEKTADAGVVSGDYMKGYRAALETIGLAFWLGEVVAGQVRIEQHWPVRIFEVRE